MIDCDHGTVVRKMGTTNNFLSYHASATQRCHTVVILLNFNEAFLGISGTMVYIRA